MADLIVPGGPRGDIETLYRQFDGGAYEAPTVAIAPFDATTGAALAIDTIHHEVHEGEMFHCSHTGASVSNAASVDVLLVTGAAVETHATWEIFAGGQVTIYLYEAPTVTEGNEGTALTAYNMKRDSDNTPDALLYHTPTVGATGSTALVNGRILPGGTNPTTRVGGGIRSGAEWILAPDTLYLLRVTNTSGGTIAINLVLEWYEEAVA